MVYSYNIYIYSKYGELLLLIKSSFQYVYYYHDYN